MKRVIGKSVYAIGFVICIFIVAACTRKPVEKGIIELANLPYHPLQSEADLDVLIEQIGDARIVMLGEASHGTSEYYTWRAAITKRLMAEKGFNFMAIEGEWADSYKVNNFIKGPAKDSVAALSVLRQYDRWPTWMWANYEVASLITWMNRFNQQRDPEKKVGFYGLDVYCLWESMTELMPYLRNHDASLTTAAEQVHKCFQPFGEDAQQYALAVYNSEANCRNQTSQLWQAVTSLTGGNDQKTEAEFVMEQNALVALNGERYYSAMVSNDQESWNIRDRHMHQTLQRLLDFHGTDSKVIVWEHNTHVGDARFTDMASAGMVNVGQLAREQFGEDEVFLVGFGSYRGNVIAADEWGANMENMRVPPAPKGTWEYMLHQQGAVNKIIFSNEMANEPTLKKQIGHRAIGVVYNPNQERGNYVPTIIPRRYDAFVFIDQSTALRPIPVQPRNEPPDTYPSGF